MAESLPDGLVAAVRAVDDAGGAGRRQESERLRRSTAEQLAAVLGADVQDVLPVTGYSGQLSRLVQHVYATALLLGPHVPQDEQPAWMRRFEMPTSWDDDAREIQAHGYRTMYFALLAEFHPFDPRVQQRWRLRATRLHVGFDECWHYGSGQTAAEWRWPELDADRVAQALRSDRPHLDWRGRRTAWAPLIEADLLDEAVSTLRSCAWRLEEMHRLLRDRASTSSAQGRVS